MEPEKKFITSTPNTISPTPRQAATIAGLAPDLTETKLTVTGWNNYWLAPEESIVLPETDSAGKTTWSCGAYYRVRLD